MPTTVQVKKAMLKYATTEKLDVPPEFNEKADAWGAGAQVLAWRVSGRMHKKGRRIEQSKNKTEALADAFFPVPRGFTILHDYHAYHHSGNRSLSVIRLIVLHDMEVTAYTRAAEAVGEYFASAAAGGSTQYGVDNDSIQQYLDDAVIPCGAPYANTNGVHIEQMGRASWTTAEWKKLAAGTLKRTAWLIAHEAKKLGIPIRTLGDAQVRRGEKGVTTHKQVTRVYGVHGGHSDPGDGYPMSYVLGLAKTFQ